MPNPQDHPSNLESMRKEWEAWQETGRILKEVTGVNWNDHKMEILHAAIVLWGERLTVLRETQDFGIQHQALDEARHKARRLGIST